MQVRTKTTTDPKLERLRTLPLFASCTQQELRRAARIVDETTALAGARLVEQGRLAQEAFVVVSGRASATVDGRPVGLLSHGACFGLVALINARPHPAEVRALDACSLLVVTPQTLDGLLYEVPGVVKSLLRSVCDDGAQRVVSLSRATGSDRRLDEVFNQP